MKGNELDHYPEGINADRHLCVCCKYVNNEGNKKGCNYFVLTDKLRPCDPEYCFLWMDDGEIKKADNTNTFELNEDRKLYEELGSAIIKQAANDYVSAHRKKYLHIRKVGRPVKHGDQVIQLDYEHTIAECRIFFKSAWFSQITTLDGETFLKNLDEKIEKLKNEEWCNVKV